MTFTANTLSVLQGTIEGSFKLWVYTTADTLGTVKGAAYFGTSLANLGVAVGDFVLVVNATAGTAAIYMFDTAVHLAAGTIASTAIVLT